MKLLVSTHRAHEDFDGCYAAFIDLTQELAWIILRRLVILQQLAYVDGAANAIEFQDRTPVYLNALPDEVRIPTKGAPLETALVQKDLRPFEARTEFDRMVVGRSGIYWTCCPKRSDQVVETWPIQYETVRKAAGI